MTEYSDYGSLYRVEDDPWMADRVDRDRDQHDAELEERADRLGRDLPARTVHPTVKREAA